MEEPLQTQSLPVVIHPGSITKMGTFITMHCHDTLFKRVTVLGEAGEVLFTVECKPFGSWSMRRTVKDASGLHLFDLREIPDGLFKYQWIVESPEGIQTSTIRHASFLNRLLLDMIVKEESGSGNQLMVKIRPLDKAGITTLVDIAGTTAAEIRLVENNLQASGRCLSRDRSVWKAQIAGGMDLALVVAIMLCRAENQHIMKK